MMINYLDHYHHLVYLHDDDDDDDDGKFCFRLFLLKEMTTSQETKNQLVKRWKVKKKE